MAAIETTFLAERSSSRNRGRCIMNISALESKALGLLSRYPESNTAVSFSGGKDSLVALDLAYRVGVRRAVFVDTTIEFEETVEYVRQTANLYDMRIETVAPPHGFFDMLEKVTSPSKRQRWCCEVIKFGPLASWAVKTGVTHFITGLRRDESVSRADYTEVDSNPLVPACQLNPILDWPEEAVWHYIHAYGLPVNPLYEHFKRVGCWCCPFKSKSEWDKTAAMYPDKIQLLKSKLDALAERLALDDRERFVDQFGWTYWIHPTRKVTIGSARLCSDGGASILVSCDDHELLGRIEELLPIVSNDYRRIGRNLRIRLGEVPQKQVMILIEKALNCVGCGACRIYCKRGALQLHDGHIYVDSAVCDRCHTCLNASTLKGSCIARHYSPKRAALALLP